MTLKTLKRRLVSKAYKLADKITRLCAPYEVRCSYGTRQAVWTMNQAYDWFACTDAVVIVVHRATGELIASRNSVE